MALYRARTLVNGAAVNVVRSCPYDNTTDITFPAYENSVNPSGLVQPWGSIDASGMPVPGGLEVYLAPSGLDQTFATPWAENTGYLGRNSTTHYGEVNFYRPFWKCNTCDRLFQYPAFSGLPAGAQYGNNYDMPFVNDINGAQRSV